MQHKERNANTWRAAKAEGLPRWEDCRQTGVNRVKNTLWVVILD